MAAARRRGRAARERGALCEHLDVVPDAGKGIQGVVTAAHGGNPDRRGAVEIFFIFLQMGDGGDQRAAAHTQNDAERLCAAFWDAAADGAGMVRRGKTMPAICACNGGGIIGQGIIQTAQPLLMGWLFFCANLQLTRGEGAGK